jgi:hypothetical protein
MRFDDLVQRLMEASNDVSVEVLDLELGEPDFTGKTHAGEAYLRIMDHGKEHDIPITMTRYGTIDRTKYFYDPLHDLSGKALNHLYDQLEIIFTKEFYDKFMYTKQVRDSMQDSDDLGFGDLDL